MEFTAYLSHASVTGDLSDQLYERLSKLDRWAAVGARARRFWSYPVVTKFGLQCQGVILCGCPIALNST